MISIVIVYLALKFNNPWVALLVLVTWIIDVVIIAGVIGLFEEIIKIKNNKKRK